MRTFFAPPRQGTHSLPLPPDPGFLWKSLPTSHQARTPSLSALAPVIVPPPNPVDPCETLFKCLAMWFKPKGLTGGRMGQDLSLCGSSIMAVLQMPLDLLRVKLLERVESGAACSLFLCTPGQPPELKGLKKEQSTHNGSWVYESSGSETSFSGHLFSAVGPTVGDGWYKGQDTIDHHRPAAPRERLKALRLETDATVSEQRDDAAIETTSSHVDQSPESERAEGRVYAKHRA
ncbi:hypothetical protein J1605_002525 [Eschrichtius robustus]|uniref:Uncharacterized protein n=1 Tax=Eschrichtius robustus TaxID=9764 RepID=A0AB34HXA9_ESCRO|nr:hypothetical protein J1605_002525 [Eschrichtius robustus]